jgi:alpha-tubulin suppressor-like RCC1 family protein
MSVYTIGNGWTGALGTGSLDSFAAGHNDDDDVLGTGTASPSHPFKIHDGPITAAAAGWGHTAFVVDGHVMLCGRPHDFANLLRLKRVPKICRDYVNRYTLKYNTRNNMNNSQDNQGATPAGVEQAALSLTEKVINYLLNDTDTSEQQQQSNPMKRNSIFVTPTIIPLPNGQKVSQTSTHTDLQVASSKSLCASAGLTAVISEHGHVYTWGVNTYGQCGVGDTEATNVWTPTQVRAFPQQISDSNTVATSSEPLGQDYPITQVSLGLQHGIALNTKGHVYVWGKADRGQLGLRDVVAESISTATRLEHFRISQADGSHQWSEGDLIFTLVAAGINHSAVRSEDNVVFVFGKNVAAETSAFDSRASQDSPVPISVRGLPANKQVVDLSCGSHHTAILLEDGSVYAFGLAAQSRTPILDAIEIIPPGIVDMPVRQFQAHFDRTTIVGKNGDQVLQVHLWSEEEDRKLAIFTPAWMDYFDGDILSVHRGWLHTVIVTKSS